MLRWLGGYRNGAFGGDVREAERHAAATRTSRRRHRRAFAHRAGVLVPQGEETGSGRHFCYLPLFFLQQAFIANLFYIISKIFIKFKFVIGLEQVHDAVEQSLLKEVATLRDAQERFKMMLEKVVTLNMLYLRHNAGTKQFFSLCYCLSECTLATLFWHRRVPPIAEKIDIEQNNLGSFVS